MRQLLTKWIYDAISDMATINPEQTGTPPVYRALKEMADNAKSNGQGMICLDDLNTYPAYVLCTETDLADAIEQAGLPVTNQTMAIAKTIAPTIMPSKSEIIDALADALSKNTKN